MLREFAVWLGATPFSYWLGHTPWVIQGLQTVHILALAAVLGSAFLLDLRLVGAVKSDDTAAHLGRRFMPAHWAGFAVLLVSGVLLIAAEPRELLFNRTLRVKLILVIAGVLLTAALARGLRVETLLSEIPRTRRNMLAAGGAASLLLWVLIAFAGRFIAYVG